MSVVVKVEAWLLRPLQLVHLPKNVLGDVEFKLLHEAFGCESLAELERRVYQEHVGSFLGLQLAFLEHSKEIITIRSYVLQGTALVM